MFEIILLIGFLYIATGLVKNLIYIYKFFMEKPETEKCKCNKQKLEG